MVGTDLFVLCKKTLDYHFLLLFFYFFCKPRSRDTPLFRRGSIRNRGVSLSPCGLKNDFVLKLEKSPFVGYCFFSINYLRKKRVAFCSLASSYTTFPPFCLLPWPEL